MNKHKAKFDKGFLQEQRDGLRKHSASGYEHYRLINKNNETVCKDSETCFGRFHYIESEGHAKHGFGAQVLLVNHPNAQTDEETNKFADWVMNVSPYAPLFIDKDVDFIASNPIAIDCNYHARLVIGAGILIRYRAQMLARVRMWTRFVNAGVNPNLAFCLAHLFEARNQHGFIKNEDGGGHGLYMPYTSVDSIGGFLNYETRGLDNDRERDKTVNGGSYSYSGLWGAWGKINNDYASTSQLKLPDVDISRKEKVGWASSEQLISYYSWENIDKFIANIIELNKLQGEYGTSEKFCGRRKKAA